MKLAISVIVPVYKTEAYLDRCIESILAQTYTDFELILVDDGSPDRSGAICDFYAERDSRVRVIHQTNQGQAAARNGAVEQARGEWICFVDSDDLIHPQMLALLYQAVLDHNARISMCSVMTVETAPETFCNCDNLDTRALDISETVLESLYQDGGNACWIVCGKLVHKDIVTAIPFANGRIYEDNAVTCRWLYAAGIVADMDASLYFYQMTPASTMRSAFSFKKLDYLWALEEIINFYDKVNYRRLCRRFCGTYLKSVNEYYPLVCHEHKNKSAKRIIRRQMIAILWKKAKYFELTKSTIYQVVCILCPFMIQLYQFLRHLWKGEQS